MWFYPCMPIDLVGVRVMLSGPSDTQRDVEVVERQISVWNRSHAVRQRVVFLPAHYTTDTVPIYRDSDGQTVINEQITDLSDVVICLFRTRLGTPTQRNPLSASVEEIEIGKESGTAHVLFWTGAVEQEILSDTGRLQQMQSLNDFRRSFESEYHGMYGVYASDEDLSATIDRTLWMHANKFRLTAKGTPTASSAAAPTDIATRTATQLGDLPTLGVTVVGPVWHVPDFVENVLGRIVDFEASSPSEYEAAADIKGRANEIDMRFAAGAALPVQVELTTSSRVTALQVQLVIRGVRGVDPSREDWREIIRPGDLTYASRLSSMALPRGTMRTWDEYSEWATAGDDVVLTIHVNDLRESVVPTIISEDLTVLIPHDKDVPDTVEYTWKATGEVDGQTISLPGGSGELAIVTPNAALSRIGEWIAGELPHQR
jgi:hypothetical protein